ncbi:CDP-alcohol phosphatidyltransferase family protein [Aureimonas sp. AU12]|uniref:CDP-alcohol phosphatidyltransferase family protein n=1 Tax=Aureimonas sp. AU12 TaxID=1638161 RepID=UPI0007818C92|nr:CDP-alcohol phosphatidyltransferase family protein [Aureimonas sp. AU12]
MPDPLGSPLPNEPGRRPIASRSSRVMIALASKLAAGRVTPNQISTLSILFAGLGALALVRWNHPITFLVAALAIQLRLLCNLLDGMVAIEGGKKSLVGALYNEFPDRVADTFLLAAAGYAAGWPDLGWAAALLAALTAYVRVFGGALGLPQDFSGIMAKQRRMALLTAGLLAQFVWRLAVGPGWDVLVWTLALIALGSLLTCITRTRTIARMLGA